MMLNIIFLIDLIGLIIAAPIYATNFDVNCGPNSLKGICNKFGLNTSIHKIQELSWFDTETGTTMFGLLRAANELKLPAVPLKISFNEFRKMNCPGIVFVDGNHFAIVWKLMKDRVVFQDWPDSCKYLTRKEFESEWRGDTIIFSRFYRWKNRKELSSLFGPFTGPKIMFNIKEKDKGDVKEGMELSYVFTFENIGSQPLTVETRPSCSCIRAVLSEKKIAPGKIGKITVLFDTNGLSGPQKKGIHVMSNDPDNRVINIFLSGNIKAFAKVIPSKLWIGRVVSGNIIKKKFDVYIPAGTTFSIYKIKTDDGIQVKMNKEKIENGNTIVLVQREMEFSGLK
ncbi:MAG: cysteine peptidase family C39 domain-containing protein, partial [Candidatus Latescibacterota bacterium]